MSYKDKPQIRLYKYEDNSFVLKAIIDDCQDLSFEHNLYSAGQFTITINYNIPNALLFERGLFVQFGNNPYDFGEIYSIQDAIGQDGKGSQIRTITGYDARYILKRRVIKNMNSNGLWTMTAKGELCLRNLIKDQCGAGAEAKRQLPIINTIPEIGIGKEYSVSEQFSNLYEVCKTIATQSEIGWRIAFDGNLTLEVYEGQDLSGTVKFDTDYESLANGDFSDSSESFSNAIYIGGKGQNDNRDIYEGEDGTPAGFDRFESWDNQSQMTTESEYEAEALSMLTQYGQTLTMSGNGLAKCPYIFREQYDIGDTVTVAFSGKSAKAQILSITEHWTWGAYDIQFSFGKPQNNLSDQLQLMLRKIQEASNKTNSTDSVRWYTIPTDTSMPKADVTYNTIGFVGTVGTGATFTLYLDNEKTGAKTYHVYFKQLGGGKLTLTTGKAGATDLVLNSGTYVAIIYVDENGNITNTASTPTNTIETGNTQPATSNGVSSAIETTVQQIQALESSLPTDAVLHYSFDEVPDYPDGTSVYFRNKNFTSTSGWSVPSDFIISVENNCLKISSNNTNRNYMLTRETNVMNTSTLNGKLIKIKIRSSFAPTSLWLQEQINYRTFSLSLINKSGDEYVYAGVPNFSVNSILYVVLGKSSVITSSDYFIIETIYIGDGSYSTPIIDNANGQNNATNNGGIAIKGVSGKGAYFPSAIQQVAVPYKQHNSNNDLSISLWLKIPSSYSYSGESSFKAIFATGAYAGLFGFYRQGNKIGFISRDTSYVRQYGFTPDKDVWLSLVAVYSGLTHNFKIYVNGELKATSSSNLANYLFGGNTWYIWGNAGRGGSAVTLSDQPAYVDDLLIFDRALSDTEVQALYLNKANTPKYYSWADWKLSQL